MLRARVGVRDGDTPHGHAQHSGGSLGPQRERWPPRTAWGQTAPNPRHTDLPGSPEFKPTPPWPCRGAETCDSDERTKQPGSPSCAPGGRCGCKAMSAEGGRACLVTGSRASTQLLPASSVRRRTWQARTSNSRKVTQPRSPPSACLCVAPHSFPAGRHGDRALSALDSVPRWEGLGL